MEILAAKNIAKQYGFKTAIKDISLSLENGKILGLMGPNGSGKTTFMKIVAGLVKPSSGTISVLKNPIGIKTKECVSFLPDKNILPKWMTADDAIFYYADFFRDFNKEKAFDMLNFVNLERTKKIREMSKGMIEKLNLTLAFSRNAKLFLLDEPLGGVDPVARKRIVETIVTTYSEDSSIIVSTHLVHDIEHMFNSVCFIHKGEVLLLGDAEQLRQETNLSIDELYIKMYQDKV